MTHEADLDGRCENCGVLIGFHGTHASDADCVRELKIALAQLDADATLAGVEKRERRREREREAWWVWHWDRVSVKNAEITMSITRWRRGSLLTVYRMEQTSDVQYWFYFPFNLGIGFSVPVSVEKSK